MSLTGCCGIVKYLVILVNLLFWIIGFALVLLSIWMLTDPTFLISMTQNENNYFIGLYILLVVGGLIVTVAFLGCCGAFKESEYMLFSFFSCLLIVLVAEVAAGTWAYRNSSKLDTYVRTAVKEAVQDEYSVVATRTATVDSIQKYFRCCGAEGPNDWQSSVYNHADRSSFVNIAISKLNVVYKVPESCCVEGLSTEECNSFRSKGLITSIATPVIYTDGCMEKLVKEITKNIKLVYIIGAGVVGIEILALTFALLMCCAIRRNDNYKN
ncbi:tetraspanin-2-like isoform X2 [Sabethes cyaneus]|uniref:tetraspanin-2-like isoform X2 n=1 Tax=Sabethes cyaneus TaxID=53552 RepID=UPI00237DE161|nr:tetraspanin-2-like isoform X2 [Sabethes cyaneus]